MRLYSSISWGCLDDCGQKAAHTVWSGHNLSYFIKVELWKWKFLAETIYNRVNHFWDQKHVHVAYQTPRSFRNIVEMLLIWVTEDIICRVYESNKKLRWPTYGGRNNTRYLWNNSQPQSHFKTLSFYHYSLRVCFMLIVFVHRQLPLVISHLHYVNRIRRRHSHHRVNQIKTFSI